MSRTSREIRAHLGDDAAAEEAALGGPAEGADKLSRTATGFAS